MKNDKYLFIHQKWLALLKDKTDLEQGLDILLLAFKDILNVQIGRPEETVVFQSTDAYYYLEQWSNFHKRDYFTF